MDDEIKKLNQEELNQVSGGTGNLDSLLEWLKAHPDFANEAKRILDSQGKFAAYTYVQQLITEYQLPAEWNQAIYLAIASL